MPYSKDNKDHRASKGPRDRKVGQALPGHKVRQAHQDHRAPLAPKVRLAHKDRPVREAVNPGLRVRRVHQARKAHSGQQDRRGRKVPPDKTRTCKDRLGLKDRRDPRVRPETPDQSDRRAMLARKDPEAQVIPVPRVFPGLKGLKVRKATSDQPALPALRSTFAHLILGCSPRRAASSITFNTASEARGC